MFVGTFMEMDHWIRAVLDKCVFSVTQDAVATYKETRNGLIGVDYSTKLSPWWVILPSCEQGLIFNGSKLYRDVSDGIILQVGTGLHFTQVYLSSEQAIWKRANSQSEHILVSVGKKKLTVMVLLSCWSTVICFFCQWSGSFLSCCGEIISSLWPSSMETSCFKSKVKFPPHFWDSGNEYRSKKSMSQVFRTSLSPGERTLGFLTHGKVSYLLASLLFICEIMYI